MAGNEFKVEIPISVSEGNKSSGSKGLLEDFKNGIQNTLKGSGIGGEKQTGGMGKNIAKVAGSVGIIAAIWQGIAPLMKPVLKMFNILLTLLLLPLMPLIRQMVTGLAKTAQNVGQAQKDAGGGTAGFLAGITELFKSPTIWAIAGAGLLAGVVGAAGIAGTVLAAISFGIIWDMLTDDEGSEKSLGDKLKKSLIGGVAMGIAALAFGAGAIPAIGIGLLTFSTTLGLSFLTDGMKDTDFKESIKSIAKGSIVGGIIAGGIIALMDLGLGAAASVVLPVGLLIFSVLGAIKMGKENMYGIEISKTIEEETTKAETAWTAFKSFFTGSLVAMADPLGTLGFLIGSDTKGSYPLVYALKLAENEWVTMENVSELAINR